MRARWLLALIAVGLFAGTGAARAAPLRSGAEARASVREPAVAGSFYPGDAGRLRAMLQRLLREAAPPVGPRPAAIVAPHAGYVFSGRVAADAWRQAQGHPIELIVILGTNHTAPDFRKVAAHPGSGFRTPLGVTAIDRDAVRALSEASPDVVLDAGPHAREHSVEVQVPFAQVLFPDARILPLIIGAPDPELCDRLGMALQSLLRGRRALVVASSDLSHYPSARDAVAVDGRVLHAITSMDARNVRATIAAEMARGVAGLGTCACGEGPILTAISAAKALGATRGTLVRSATSADVPEGEPGRVVGYGAVVFDAGAEIDAAARSVLLGLARESIASYLATGRVAKAGSLPKVAALRRGVFVTLRRAGHLRGCIGTLTADSPLGVTVAEMAVEAAVRDPRFDPVSRAELRSLAIEISVLTPSRPVARAADVVVGRDGVVLSKAGRSAVFLPKVAVEQGWGREELLDELCQKGGMAAGCWREGASLSVFQAEVFEEAR